MSAQATVSVAVNGALDATIDIGTVIHNILYNASYPLGNGSGADLISQIFTDTRTIAPSSNDDLDLAGSLVNALGATVTFTKIIGLLVKASSANVNDCVVGGAAANQFLTPFGAAIILRLKVRARCSISPPSNLSIRRKSLTRHSGS